MPSELVQVSSSHREEEKKPNKLTKYKKRKGIRADPSS